MWTQQIFRYFDLPPPRRACKHKPPVLPLYKTGGLGPETSLERCLGYSNRIQTWDPIPTSSTFCCFPAQVGDPGPGYARAPGVSGFPGILWIPGPGLGPRVPQTPGAPGTYRTYLGTPACTPTQGPLTFYRAATLPPLQTPPSWLRCPSVQDRRTDEQYDHVAGLLVGVRP